MIAFHSFVDYYLRAMKYSGNNECVFLTTLHKILWWITVAAGIGFLLASIHFGYFPTHWIILGALFLFLLLAGLGFWAYRTKGERFSRLAGIVLNLVLILFLGTSALYLPTLRQRLGSVFTTKDGEESSLDFTEPFTIYIAGNDQEGDLSTSGRYDVNMIVTVNFKTSDVLITSIPRDSYLPNPAYNYGRDKLTHMGLSGVENSMLTVSEAFNTSVNHYVIVNFTTFRNIVDALGGVHIRNPYGFDSSLSDYIYPEGDLLLDGYEALFYVRERFNLPAGDFDRNAHQVIMLKAILQELLNPGSIFKLDEVFKALESTFLTNVPNEQIDDILRYELQNLPNWNIINYHIRGGSGLSPCSSHGGEVLSVVYPYEDDIEFIATQLDKIYEGQKIYQRLLPSEQ